MFNSIIASVSSVANKVLSSSGATQEVAWAVLHYIAGGGKDRKLPSSFMERSREEVLDTLIYRWENPSWSNLVGNLFPGCSWFYGSGVVGTFCIEVEVQEEGLLAKCWDLWDFNPTSEPIYFQGPEGPVKTLAKVLGVPLREQDGGFVVLELDLVRFNKDHAYYHRWEHFYPWEELGFDREDVYISPDGNILMMEGAQRTLAKQRVIDELRTSESTTKGMEALLYTLSEFHPELDSYALVEESGVNVFHWRDRKTPIARFSKGWIVLYEDEGYAPACVIY